MNSTRKFLNSSNRLYDAMKLLKDVIEIEPILEEMTKYADYHFETEEKYFDLFNYEEKEIHKNQHNEYRRKTSEFYEKYKSDEKFLLSFDILDFLENWWLGHINNSDKKYIKCFNDHNLR
ncbi:MAG: bacteriohemerythrin [Patescibacteria group bacterium]